MTRAVLACLLLLPAAHLAAGTCGNADVTAHGSMHYFADTDCWQFAADDGSLYEIVSSPANILREGLTGVMQALWSPLMMPSHCGMLVDVCSFDADATTKVVGTLRHYDLAGGCFRLEAPNKVYAPLSLDPNFYRDGMQVRVEGIYLPNVCSACQAPVLEVVNYDFIGACPGQCQQAYRDCQRVCAANPCLVSCDVVYSACLDSCQ
jgi:hypothetical protein